MPLTTPHLPRLAPIESYGNGGFRFAGVSHRGSLLCLPEGIWAWAVVHPSELTPKTLAPLLEASTSVDMILIGSGADPWIAPEELRTEFHQRNASIQVMLTGSAVRIFNIVLGERRRVAAALIAVP